MKKILKYNLDDMVGRCQPVMMPISAKIISVGNQNGSIKLWAEVEVNDNMLVGREFYVFGTGQNIPQGGLKHVGSVIMDHLVWHVCVKELYEIGFNNSNENKTMTKLSEEKKQKLTELIGCDLMGFHVMQVLEMSFKGKPKDMHDGKNEAQKVIAKAEEEAAKILNRILDAVYLQA